MRLAFSALILVCAATIAGQQVLTNDDVAKMVEGGVGWAGGGSGGAGGGAGRLFTERSAPFGCDALSQDQRLVENANHASCGRGSEGVR